MPVPAAIRDHFERQVEACNALGSPFTANLCRLVAENLENDTAFGRRVYNWSGDPRDDALSLRVCGALHALARSGAEPALTAAYPPAEYDEAALWAAVAAVIPAHDDWLTAFLDSAPQTNEVARSAIILGAALHVAQRTGLPLEVFEIGASAGLNIGFDEYRYDLGDGVAWGRARAPVTIACDWRGNLPPLDSPLSVVARAGCDLRPLDPASADDAERLMAYIWADQDYRLKRTGAALRLAAAEGRTVAAVDAGEWVEAKLAQPPAPNTCRFLFHTIVWQYMPSETQQRIEAALATAAAVATPETPLARFAFEPDHTSSDGLMTLTIWPGGETRILGRAHFHGRYARWA